MTLIHSDNEAARLNALRDLRLLDTPPSEAFDRLTRLASKFFNAPVSTISLTDGDRQWFKSRVGVDLQEIPRHQAPCSYAIQSDRVFVVPDLLADERFRDSPLAQAGIRFYAGAPLITRAGFGLGTICVVDDAPRTIDTEGERILRDLAGMVMAQIDVQNMIGRTDPVSGEANEHQFFEDLDDAAGQTPGEPRVALLAEFASNDRVMHGVRVLGNEHVEELVRTCIARLRSRVGNAIRLYHVGSVRCVAVWDEQVARSGEDMIVEFGRLLAEPVTCNGVPVVLDPALGMHRFRLARLEGRTVLRALFNAADDARRSASPHATYDERQDRKHSRSFGILQEVPHALTSQGSLSLVYQPRVAMSTGRCTGAEALIRWHHRQLGPLSPAEFIPLLEQTAFVGPLTD